MRSAPGLKTVIVPSRSVATIAFPVAAASTPDSRSRLARTCSSSRWMLRPAIAATASTSSALRGVLAGYWSPPISAHGSASATNVTARSISSWRRLPYSASHMAGRITSGAKPPVGPSAACRSRTMTPT